MIQERNPELENPLLSTPNKSPVIHSRSGRNRSRADVVPASRTPTKLPSKLRTPEIPRNTSGDYAYQSLQVQNQQEAHPTFFQLYFYPLVIGALLTLCSASEQVLRKLVASEYDLDFDFDSRDNHCNSYIV